MFNSYMSDDRHITTIDVILEDNPYGNGAIAKVKDIEASVNGLFPTRICTMHRLASAAFPASTPI
ncbi:hypothetical protein PO124_26280 [Bacillus licheniformis]|nr:hypothetical protein [Bacillus licheniformis]